jgi:hypothetical protein
VAVTPTAAAAAVACCYIRHLLQTSVAAIFGNVSARKNCLCLVDDVLSVAAVGKLGGAIQLHRLSCCPTIMEPGKAALIPQLNLATKCHNRLLAVLIILEVPISAVDGQTGFLSVVQFFLVIPGK